MKPLHSKKKRTTLNEAQMFIKKGHGSGMKSEDYISNTQRNEIVSKVGAELLEVVKRRFPRTANLEYAILKGHLIIEYALTQYIRCSSYVLVEIDNINFSFSKKLEISILMGFGNGDPTLIPSIELFNKLRNQVAHKFEINKNLVDEIIRLNCDEEWLIDLNDRTRIRCLKAFCASICGRILGAIEAKVFLLI